MIEYGREILRHTIYYKVCNVIIMCISETVICVAKRALSIW